MKKRKCSGRPPNRQIGTVLIALGLLALMILVLPPIAWLVGAALALVIIGMSLLRKK